MQLPRSSQLDDRRRRVLTEEVIGGAGPDSASAASSLSKASSRRRRSAAAVRPYGDTALLDEQPRITDLIPRRYGVLALLFLAGVTAVAGLEALYAFLPELASKTADGTLAAFDLEAEGSLAAWFSSSTLSLAAAVAVVTYSIRRHKADDYHGRYRIWLWAAACWLVMSMDEGGSLHEAFRELMSGATGRRGYGDGSIWWIGLYSFALGAVGTRLALEMRDCRSSTASLFVAAGCYAAAVLAKLDLIFPGAGALRVMVEEGAEMAGDLCLLFAMTLHARYVILDAQGLLPAKQEQPAKPPKAEKPAKPEKAKPEKVDRTAAAEAEPAAAEPAPSRSWFRKSKIDPAHGHPPAPKHQGAKSPPPVAAAAKPSARPAEIEDDDDDAPRHARRSRHDNRRDESADDRNNRPLSKAERKALRREQNRLRDEDEA
ncbi:MAG TPA: hypothetical protein VMV10_31720 [Pirellulales bacterium]|nr:hypothetical protein [Pirellulales bacterium]